MEKQGAQFAIHVVDSLFRAFTKTKDQQHLFYEI